MTMRPWRALAGAGGVCALLAAAWGCSSSSSNATASASVTGDAGSQTVDAGTGEGGMTYALQWAVIEGAGPAGDAATSSAADDASSAEETDGGSAEGGGEFSSPPIPGVQVCVYQMPSIQCATTASDGTFTLQGLPGGTDLSLTLNKAGYQPTLRPIQTARTDMDGRSNPIFLNSSAAVVRNVPVAINTTTLGQIVAFAIGPSTNAAMTNFPDDPGAKVALSPASGNGPYYLSDGGIDPTATSYEGFYAYFFNVAPGTYTLTYTDTKNDCEAINFPFSETGFPVPTPPHSVQVPIVAGYMTGVVGVLCTPNTAVVGADGG